LLRRRERVDDQERAAEIVRRELEAPPSDLPTAGDLVVPQCLTVLPLAPLGERLTVDDVRVESAHEARACHDDGPRPTSRLLVASTPDLGCKQSLSFPCPRPALEHFAERRLRGVHHRVEFAGGGEKCLDQISAAAHVRLD
jgi:hypothetical protein